jgi:DNA-binding NtrC family response regulator
VADCADTALGKARKESPDLVLLDICLPDTSGLDLLTRLRGLKPRAPAVILMTAYESTRDAVLAMKRGAYDYLGKPFNIDAVCLLAKRALDHARRAGQLLRGGEKGRAHDKATGPPTADGHGPWQGSACDRMIGASAAMREVLDVIRRLPAGSASNVLIEGETGTGKELVAHAIHETNRRGASPFVAIGCGAIPPGLVEAELFGYDKGAFTGALREGKLGAFERARDGTIFLDEIAELEPDLQVKLLRVLEAREFSRVGGLSEIPLRAQVIAATNRDLGREVGAGRFRPDLYFRLNVLRVKLPPLRERGGDVMLLAEAFMLDFSSRFGKCFKAIAPRAQKLLGSYSWPGNVRELRNAMERVVLIEDDARSDKTILPEHLSACVSAPGQAEGRFSFEPSPGRPDNGVDPTSGPGRPDNGVDPTSGPGRPDNGVDPTSGDDDTPIRGPVHDDLAAPPAKASLARRTTTVLRRAQDGRAAIDPDRMECGGRDGKRRSIVFALERTGGNVVKAARLLGIKRGALRYRMDKYGVTREWPYESDLSGGLVVSSSNGGIGTPQCSRARGRSNRSLLNSEA